MSKCKFTIITVCYNAEKYIEDTIRSVITQSYENFEYLIKDGQSGDNTIPLVHTLIDGDNRVTLMQAADQGIYDAMNIAASAAKGDYIFFLNAGDKFADGTILERVAAYVDSHEADIFYGNIIEIESLDKKSSHLRVYTEKNSKLWYYSLGACLCHQAMFCKRELFWKKQFDLKYQVCADREWQMYHISKGAAAKPLGFTVAEVLMEGFSASHVTDLERETRQCIKMYCGLFFWGYEILMLLKKSKIVRKVIRGAEKQISCK